MSAFFSHFSVWEIETKEIMREEWEAFYEDGWNCDILEKMDWGKIVVNAAAEVVYWKH